MSLSKRWKWTATYVSITTCTIYNTDSPAAVNVACVANGTAGHVQPIYRGKMLQAETLKACTFQVNPQLLLGHVEKSNLPFSLPMCAEARFPQATATQAAAGHNESHNEAYAYITLHHAHPPPPYRLFLFVSTPCLSGLCSVHPPALFIHSLVQGRPNTFAVCSLQFIPL